MQVWMQVQVLYLKYTSPDGGISPRNIVQLVIPNGEKVGATVHLYTCCQYCTPVLITVQAIVHL